MKKTKEKEIKKQKKKQKKREIKCRWMLYRYAIQSANKEWKKSRFNR